MIGVTAKARGSEHKPLPGVENEFIRVHGVQLVDTLEVASRSWTNVTL